MLKISQQQALDRWDILPQNIREAIFSDANADLLRHICEKNHLSEERAEAVAIVASDVLLGFLHSNREEMGQEIMEQTGIPRPVALAITEEISLKIFFPLRDELERIYSPVTKEQEIVLEKKAEILKTATSPVVESSVASKQEIKPDITSPVQKIEITKEPVKIPPLTMSASTPPPSKPADKIEAIPINRVQPPTLSNPWEKTGVKVEPVAPPKPLNANGLLPKEMDVFGANKETKIEPFDSAQDKPFGSAPSTSLRTGSSSADSQAKPFDSTQAKPFIIHEAKEFVAPSLPKTMPSVTFDPIRESTPSPAPAQKNISARVEGPGGTSKDTVRVVHYSAMKTTLDKATGD